MLDLASCDVVFLSFDEPNADENFARTAAEVPRARRLHGVKGFDAAHRRAGEIATTSHVVTIDADNVLLVPELLSGRFDVAPRDLGSVFSFSARNVLNGLEYGNGGLKIWPRHVLATLRTHERAGRAEAAVDFCWTVPYYQVTRVVSEVHMTATPCQAFRGGFREGVKLNLADGRLAYDVLPSRPRSEALPAHVGTTSYERLRIWCSVGAEIPNGDWAIFGARLGCAMTALDGFDHSLIADYAWFHDFWQSEVLPAYGDDGVRSRASVELGRRLNDELGLAVADLSPAASAFVKSVYRSRRAAGSMSVV